MIPLFKVAMNPTADKAVGKVLSSGFIGQGEVVEKFELDLKICFNNPYLVTLNSGTSALTLALRIIKDKHPEKKYIISTPLTCTATNWAILAAGFEIIWADIEPHTLNICPLSVAKSVTPLVAAVMVVHWGGAAADVKKIKALTGLDIIEDCAHAFGSYYELPATQDEGTKVGNSGNYCCFSFQAIKHLTTGDGGMLILPNEEDYKKINAQRAKILVINPFNELRKLKLKVKEIPVLIPYLADENYMPTFSYWRDFHLAVMEIIIFTI